MNRLNYDYGYVTKKRNGFNTCQITTSVHGDSAWELYRFKRRSWIPYRSISVMCVVVAILFVLSFEFGWINPIYDLFLK